MGNRIRKWRKSEGGSNQRPHGGLDELEPAVGNDLGVRGKEQSNARVKKTLKVSNPGSITPEGEVAMEGPVGHQGRCHVAKTAGAARRISSVLGVRVDKGALTALSYDQKATG